jgi:FKBP-type peptidyl-prolyl cis-trans isomerase SlyD
MRIANNCVVALKFTLHDETGHLLDSSPEGEHLEYVHGAAGILPELERQLAGKDMGESFDVSIAPERGFGHRQPTLVEIIARAEWSEAHKMKVGDAVTRTAPDGATQSFFITAMDADSITIDGNHPLAGKTLRFQGTVLSVRPATAEELKSV